MADKRVRNLDRADYFTARCECGEEYNTLRREGSVHYPEDRTCGLPGTVIRGYRYTN